MFTVAKLTSLEGLRVAYSVLGPVETQIDGHCMLIKLRDGAVLTVTGSHGSPVAAVQSLAAAWNMLPTVISDLNPEPVVETEPEPPAPDELTDPGADAKPRRSRKTE